MIPKLQTGMKELKACSIGGSALILGAGAAVWIWRWRKSSQLRQKAINKRKAEQEYIQNQLKYLSEELDQEQVQKILELSGTELLKQLQDGTLKPIDVLKTYLYKACKATTTLNCVTEVVRDCQEVARNLSRKKPKDFPLYGLPVSLKECLQTKGSASTIGWAKYIDNIAEEDCVLAKVLKHRGAVPFVKTNVSQMILSFESSNPIYGQTSNPRNPNFGPGGSSSGEGSIVGAGASLLGFGTDTGGSIRAPSHLCGVCGFKPTLNRLSHDGLIPPYAMTSVTATVGPLAQDVDTIVEAMRALLCDFMFKLDPSVVPLKFREELYNCKQPMRIGYYDDDGYQKPIPACQRAVRIAKKALEEAGHTLIPFKVPNPELMINLATTAIFADSGQTCVEMLKDDVVDESFLHLYRRWTVPSILRKIWSKFMSYKSPRIAADIMAHGGGGNPSAYNLWQVRAKIEGYKSKFWKDWREKYKLDAMICPAYPLVACPKGMLVNTTGLMCYTVLYNFVNGPAGQVPVTKVTQKDIDELQNYRGHHDDSWDEHVKTATVGSINMPVAVQCASSPWNEEVCLRLMKEVETLLVK